MQKFLGREADLRSAREPGGALPRRCCQCMRRQRECTCLGV
jgi:hypothetical protein